MIDKTLERLDFILRRKNDNTNFPPRNPSNGFDEICEMDAKDPQEIQFKLRVRVKEGEIFEIWRRKLTLEIFSDWMKKTKRKPRGDDCFDDDPRKLKEGFNSFKFTARGDTLRHQRDFPA